MIDRIKEIEKLINSLREEEDSLDRESDIEMEKVYGSRRATNRIIKINETIEILNKELVLLKEKLK